MKTELKEIELSVCADCYCFFHYGLESFEPQLELTKDQQQKIIDSFNEILKDYQIFDNHDSENGSSFSWSSCNICNSSLGGDRFGLLQIEHDPGKTS